MDSQECSENYFLHLYTTHPLQSNINEFTVLVTTS